MAESSNRKPFLKHVHELRTRLFQVVIALLIGALVGYFIKDYLLILLVAPLGQTLYYTSPGGGFTLIIQICLGFGVIFSTPVFIYHLIKFLSPLFPNYSRKFMSITLLCSCILLTLGVLFAYFISLPAALYFLNEFSNEQVQSLISTDTYMSFVLFYLAGFAALSQLPLILLIANSVYRLNPKKMLANTKWVILASFIIAAIITPTPDPFNQFIMAAPIIFLYLLSIGVIRVVNSKNDHKKNLQGDTINGIAVSEIEIVKRKKTTYKNRQGDLCFWKYKDKKSDQVIATFFFEGKHEYIKTLNIDSTKNKLTKSK